jgi:L-ascorbate metabolism protein UlaG (beta-lactamase superfamily)
MLWTIMNYINSTAKRVPDKVIPSVEFDKDNFEEWSYVWFWHSTILMNIDWLHVISDPVFHEASPISFWWKPFAYSHKPEVWDLPNIDIMIISHDHYDHLDYKTIWELDKKVVKYLVPLWIKSHLLKWWIDENKITEFDWQDSTEINNVKFVFTPARHFSWRGILNGSTTLWWSWVIQWENENIYFSGDSWYFDGFKTIWEKYWPFDVAFIENGAYNDAWNEIHMYPEQSVQAGIDLRAKNIMPIHWWKFDLALHSWYEPIERFTQEAENKKINYFHPRVWEKFTLDTLPKNNWWEEIK